MYIHNPKSTACQHKRKFHKFIIIRLKALHLAGGCLFSGAVFVCIGLAKNLSVCGPELDSAINSPLKKVQRQASPSTCRSLSDITAAAKSVIPISGKAYALVFPGQADDAFCITYSLPAQGMNQNEWHQVYVNSYTAQVTGQRLTTRATLFGGGL